jgi:hypothetical protein
MRALAVLWFFIFTPVAVLWVFWALLASFGDSKYFERQCGSLLRVWTMGQESA